MIKYIIKRLLLLIPVLIGVSLLIFALLYVAPGDPAKLTLGNTATEADLEAFREKYGLNDSLFEQYGKYMFNIVTKGDFGTSYRSGKSVTVEIVSRWPYTVLIAVLLTVISLIIGGLLGILAALKRGKWVDSICQVLAVAGVPLSAASSVASRQPVAA